MTLEKQLTEKVLGLKENLKVHEKKIDLIDKEIKDIKDEGNKKISELQQERTMIVAQVLKDRGAIEKIEEVFNVQNQVESK